MRNPSARAGLNVAGLAEFFFAQFAVFGPILFGALLITAMRWRRLDQTLRCLILFALPIVAIVCVQALLSRAYANWAAAAYLAGTLAAIGWLLQRHRAWLIASFAINGTLCLIFPLATTVADTLRLGREQPVLERYIGRTEMTEAILAVAEAEGVASIVATDRDILADLFYSARGRSIRLFALPPTGRAPHHYALRFPYRAADEEILIVTRASEPLPCREAQVITEIAPESGAYRRHPQRIYRANGVCLE